MLLQRIKEGLGFRDKGLGFFFKSLFPLPYSLKKTSGLSLLESMIATAIVGVGFVGVYTLTVTSEQFDKSSIMRQELQMQANQILDVIESDLVNIDSYDNMNLAVCNPLGAGQVAKFQVRGFEWCTRLIGEVGAATATETRSVDVTTLADGRKVVHILLEANNDTVQIVMKRIYDN